MTLFGIVFLAALAVAALGVFLVRPPTGVWRMLGWAAIGLGLGHLVVLRHATFIPAYLATLPLYFALRGRDSAPRRPVLAVLSWLAVALSAVLLWAAPNIRIPAPTGPYAVGSRWLAVVDSSRAEDFASDTLVRRTLLLRIWYPADTTGPVRAPLMTATQARVLAKGMSFPPFVFRHLSRVPTHTYPDVALSGKAPTWPVVLFSHGFGIGYESQNTSQVEELASHGYVVVGMSHPYEAGVVELPGGVVIEQAPSEFMDTATNTKLLALVSRMATSDTTELNRVTAEMRAAMKLEPSITRWMADTRFVADLLATWKAEAPLDGFAGRLQTDRLGIFGMSFGGATAASFCAVDARCAAGVNLDGLTFGPAVDTLIPRPFLFASSSTNGTMHDTYFRRATGPVWQMTVARTLHLDYTDLSWVSPAFAKIGALGGMDPNTMAEIMNRAVRGMMDAHLTGRTPFDSAGLAGIPGVTLRSRRQM